jgi:hypothetical protein
MSMKNPLTPAGIEPASFQLVSQHLNHSATAVPLIIIITAERNVVQKEAEKLKYNSLCIEM